MALSPATNPAIVVGLAAPPLTWLSRSWKIELLGAHAQWRELESARKPYVLLAWHDAMLPLLWHYRRTGMTIVVSEALEGRYLAGYAARLGYREARGSSTRGGVRALLGAVRVLRAGGTVAFTPDGPRGPRRTFKGGILMAAQRGMAPVVPVHAGARHAWRLRSWDRLLIPKPFTRVRIAYGTPFCIEPGPTALAEAQERAEAELRRAVEQAENGSVE